MLPMLICCCGHSSQEILIEVRHSKGPRKRRDLIGGNENAGFQAKVQRIVGIYPYGWIGYCPTSLKKGNGTFAETQTTNFLHCMYAHRSVMQRQRQVATAGGAPRV